MSTITKLNYLSDTKDEIKVVLNSKFNVGITDNDTFRSYVDKIKGIYNNWPKVTGEGTEITLTPTRKGRMSIGLKGNTSQVSTSIDGGDEYDSPSRDYPQPIHVVTGNNTISIGSNNHSINLGNDEYYNINDFADEIFKNIPTNSHYDNSLVEGAWYKYSNNKKKILDGTENWNYTSGVFLLSDIVDYKLSTTNICLCSHYKTQNCVTATSQINDKCATFRSEASTKRFYIKDSSFSNLGDFKTFLSDNNITLIYRLDTPTITQITDETLISQLDTIENAMSTTGTTTITQTNADLSFIISASALKKGGN